MKKAKVNPVMWEIEDGSRPDERLAATRTMVRGGGHLMGYVTHRQTGENGNKNCHLWHFEPMRGYRFRILYLQGSTSEPQPTDPPHLSTKDDTTCYLYVDKQVTVAVTLPNGGELSPMWKEVPPQEVQYHDMAIRSAQEARAVFENLPFHFTQGEALVQETYYDAFWDEALVSSLAIRYRWFYEQLQREKTRARLLPSTGYTPLPEVEIARLVFQGQTKTLVTWADLEKVNIRQECAREYAKAAGVTLGSYGMTIEDALTIVENLMSTSVFTDFAEAFDRLKKIGKI